MEKRINTAIVRLVLSPWFLALLPFLIGTFFIADVGRKYQLTVESREKITHPVIYADLDNDTTTERIALGNASLPYKASVSVLDNDGRWYDQWNLTGNYIPHISNLYAGNFDHDAFGEIYTFTMSSDSLFIQINEFFQKDGTRQEHVFITRITLFKNEVTSWLHGCGFFDHNGDGKDEFYFGISTGYGLAPRMIYAYDLVNRQVRNTPYTSIGINAPAMRDADGDGRPEIFGQVNASGNHHFPTPYSDYSAWVMVFGDDLTFKFKPVEFAGFANSVRVHQFKTSKGGKYIAVFSHGKAGEIAPESKLVIYDTNGLTIQQKPLSDFGIVKPEATVVLPNDGGDRLIFLSNPMLVFDEDLNLIDKVSLPFHSSVYPVTEDLDGDGKDELFVYSAEEQKLVVYKADLETSYGEMEVSASADEWVFSHIVDSAKEHKLFLKAGSSEYIIQLFENPFYWLTYLAYPAMYLFFVAFIAFIGKINREQATKREIQKRKLLTLQLQSIKSQLDPHFMFNALNSVASLLYLEDRDTAYDALNKFTRLLRQMLNDADRIYRSLKEELEFVTGYLNLEKLRFPGKFDYDIQVGEGVTLEEQVPKMVLQTFAENAVKHGLVPKGGGGLLKIVIDRHGDLLGIRIEDNGIGRVNASKQRGGTGKGLHITTEFYSLLNQFNKKPITKNINDLYTPDKEPAGTVVEILLPAGSAPVAP